jgi:LemA protein
MWDFIKFVFWLIVISGAVLAFFALKGYNGLRSLAEEIREAWSNIGVSAKKQASLLKQLIEVVQGYQESEKLIMLKVSEDTSSAAGLAQLHQQAGLVMSSVSGLAQKFPQLKADEQYQRLITSIQECETALERARQHYNGAVKGYNTLRSSIPHVFYASTLGFKQAPYLEFDGSNLNTQIGELASFSADADGERLNQLLGAAGSSAKRLGGMAISGSVQLANKALESGKVLAETAKEKAEDFQHARDEKARQAATDAAMNATPSLPPPAPEGMQPKPVGGGESPRA